MHQPFRSALLSIMLFGSLAGIALSSCKSPAGRSGDQEDSILVAIPFAPITDSIRQTPPAAAAGLYFRRGQLLAQNNLHEMALRDYKRSWDLRREPETGLRYAATLSILGHTDEAIRLLQDCLKIFPSDDQFSRMLGDIYEQSGKMKDALSLYENQLKADSSNFEAWFEKGLLLEKARDTAGAILALKKAYSLQPLNTYALELAHLYAEKGNSMALQLCDEVLRKDSVSGLTDPLFIKGIYYSNTGMYSDAIAQFDSCIRRDWKFTDAYLEKGIIFFRQRKYGDAQNTFQLTITVSNTDPDGYYWMGRCFEVMGKKDEAILYYQQAVALDKDFPEAMERIKKLKG